MRPDVALVREMYCAGQSGQKIACALGVSRHSVEATIDALVAAGALIRRRGNITIIAKAIRQRRDRERRRYGSVEIADERLAANRGSPLPARHPISAAALARDWDKWARE